MHRWNPVFPLMALGVIGACAIFSQPEGLRQVGPQTDGSVLLPTGWSIRPAGTQIETDTFPMASAMAPGGKYMAVLHGGYNPPSVVMLETATLKQVAKVDLPDAWLGLAFAPDGKALYVGGGSRAAVYALSVGQNGELARTAEWKLTEAAPTHEDFTGDVQVSPDGRLLYIAMLHRNTIAVINPQSGRVIERFATGRRPYRILMHPDNQSFFVTAMGDAAVLHHKASDGQILERVRVGATPMDMVWRGAKTVVDEEGEEEDKRVPWKARIFVTASNTNSVYVIGVAESKALNLVETINLSLTPVQPVGSTPSALALSPDEKKLYVVCSDLNAVASVFVEGKRSLVEGFIPSGWYPIAARSLGESKLLIFNGRGKRSFPNNVNGPNPLVRPAPLHLGGAPVAYVGRLQKGTISVVTDLDGAAIANYTATVKKNSPFREEQTTTNALSSAIVPAEVGVRSTAIEHVIYVVKENRTYDQMLGDLGKGNGDAGLTLFGEDVAPNHRKLAREFVLFDNFYVNADVSADGHNWSTAAIAPAYVQRMWPNSYAGRRKHYDYEGGEVAANAPAGRIWNNALSAGLTVRNYGWWAENLKTPEGTRQIARVKDPQLAPHTAMNFRGFDLDYLDVDRVKVFLEDLRGFEASGKMPHFMTIRIGNDHTSGLSANKLSPKAQVADNDLALGMLIEGLSKSKFWAKTAVFVLEDDAQNGADHVDSHRSPVYVISPYTRRGTVDSTMYNTTSVLRTMELLLGLRPMTTYDASSTPMTRAFASMPRLDAYTAVKPAQALDERNPGAGPLAARSARMDWDEADEVDDNELNQILWLALKGGTPPAPVRSLFGGR
jgi:DNA-binding beta-propeller fold protein YncE